jgi:hypothetical protein
MSKVSKRERDIWRAAITLANNICVQRSDRHNREDCSSDRVNEAADCANDIRAWIEPTDEQLHQMFSEACVYVERDFMSDALNSGDGVYRP